jgi:hypothetical protein
MLNELVSIFEVVDRVLEKRKVNAAQRIRDKVLVAIYELGNKGSHAVTSAELETKGGFSKLQIFDAIESAKSSDWIIDASSFDGMAWMLKQKAIYYIEGLLESKGTGQ